MYNQEPRFFITPMISIHNDEIYLYGKQEWIQERPPRHVNSINNLKDNSTHNQLSEASRRKAKRAIKYLIFNSSEKKVYNPKFKSSFVFKINFITLTLPSKQIHTDQTIKKECLNQFLIEAKKKWNLTNYIWRAEKQKNGNIHFHILSDRFIPFQELRDNWNRIVEKLGYVTRFRQKNGLKKPNSTDIHSLNKVKNVSQYILKYMVKKEETLCNDGRIWATSTTLSNIKGGQDEIEKGYEKELQKIKELKRTKTIEKDYITMIFFDSERLTEQEFPRLYKLLNDYLKTIFKEPKNVDIYPYQVPTFF